MSTDNGDDSDSSLHTDATSLIQLEKMDEDHDTRSVFEKNFEEPLGSNFVRWGLVFKGSSVTYYKIWLTSLILTVVSFGVYSAWAKQKKQNFFYSNTYLADSPFEYSASGFAILKGRVFVLTIYLILALCLPSPLAPLYAAFILYFTFPWLLVRVMIFKASNISYKNLTFRFLKNYHASFSLFLSSFFITVISLGVGGFWCRNNALKFLAKHCKFGKTNFRYTGSSKTVYYSFFSSLVLASILPSVGYALLGPSSGLDLELSKETMKYLSSTVALVSGLILLIVFCQLKATLYNNTWNNMYLDKISFIGKASGLKFLRLYSGNLALLFLSLGLAYPLISLRNHRFKVDNTRIRISNNNDLQDFVDSNRQPLGAVDEAAKDFWDLELGL